MSRIRTPRHGRPGSTRPSHRLTDRRRRSRLPLLERLEGRAVPATITVTSLGDTGPGTLRAAIEQANADPAKDTIDFAPEVTGAIALRSALPALATDMDLVGPGASVLTVERSDEAGITKFRIFEVAENATVSITGLTIARGQASHAEIIGSKGGPIPVEVGDGGGGVFNRGNLVLANDAFLNDWQGFGIVPRGGAIVNDGMLAITDSTVSDGGGIANGGMMTITDSTISNNSESGVDNGGTLTITDSTISGNRSAPSSPVFGLDSGSGGGIFNGGTLTVTGSAISGNTAAASLFNTQGGQGGGTYNFGMLTVTDSTISGNMAASGISPGFGRLDGSGGGIYNFGTLTVIASTLGNNSAAIGGGIDFSESNQPSTLTLLDNLFASSQGGSLAVHSGMFRTLGHNLFADAPDVVLDPTDLINTDPLLGPLAANGGPTMTQALLPGSPAIDAGIAAPGVTTDQRGVPRPQGLAPDIGAFESRGFTLAIAGGDHQSTPALSAFPAPLIVTVASPSGEPVAGGRVTFTAPAAGPSAVLGGSPAAIGTDGRAMVTAAANVLAGTYPVTAEAPGAGPVAFTLTNGALVAAIGLAPTAGTATVGQTHTVTATVTTPAGTPVVGAPVTFQIVAGPDRGATGATAPADGRTDADGVIRFRFVGAGGPGTDTLVATATPPGGMVLASAPVTVTFLAAPMGPPRVMGLHRLGFHHQPTRLVLSFSAPLDPARAQDLANYRLVRLRPHHRSGRPIPLVAARYNPAADAVTLAPSRRLPLRGTYQLTVVGTPPGGLTDASGVFLDGAGNGQPGSNFVTIINHSSLVLPPELLRPPARGRRPLPVAD